MSHTARIAALVERVDVVILGAGINGAGLFRDLCEQGIRCLIVDKGDFGAGTSAAPSRLIHGGLKYLETGEFRLVAQSTLERNLLLRNAPHCVLPLPTVIPIFSWTKGMVAALRTLCGATTAPRERGAVLIKLGLALYDHYGARARVMPRHRLWSKARALRELPGLTPRIVAAGTYYDATISHPERLVFELLVDGMAAEPASLALNHVALTGCDNGILTLQPPEAAAFSVKPRLVINAAGPWIDQVNAALGTPTRLIGGTKGSHILLEHPELLASLNGRMIYFEADDGRICLVFDYLGKALVGSTDFKAANPDTVHCDDDEISYFIGALRGLLPGLRFDRSQIRYAYSGIRPLPASDASNPGLISRDHSAPLLPPDHSRPFPVISLVGGKWTTFRGFAEEVADRVLLLLQRQRVASTRDMPIGGGAMYPLDDVERRIWLAEAARTSGFDMLRIDQLLDRYGTRATGYLRHRCRWRDDQRLPDAAEISLAEIDWIARTGSVVHLADLTQRRTTLGILGQLGGGNLAVIVAVTGEALGWDASRLAAETAALRAELALHRVAL